MRGERLSRFELFAELRRRNVAKVEVQFSGGGDEGGVDSISLQDAEGNEIGTLEEDYGGSQWDGQKWVPVNPPNPDTALVNALCAPVYDKYGSFAGEFYVSGKINVDVAAETIKMPYQESVETYEDHEEEF